MNDRPDHTTFRELVNLEADGSLNAADLARLDAHAAECDECRGERAELRALADFLQQGQLPVRADFHQRVMEALPPAGWEARHPRTWTFPAAVFAALLGSGVALLGLGSPRLGSAYNLMAAVGGMMRAALVAGIGFTTASWRWFGMFVEQLLASPMSLVMFGVFVVSLNLVLMSLIRRRRASQPAGAPGPFGAQGAAARGAGWLRSATDAEPSRRSWTRRSGR